MIVSHDSLFLGFDRETLRRGRNYHREGRVVELEVSHREIRGLVDGTARDPYEVIIPLSASGIDLYEAECSCPVTYNCKHMVALLMEYRSAGYRREIRLKPGMPFFASAGRIVLTDGNVRVVKVQPVLTVGIDDFRTRRFRTRITVTADYPDPPFGGDGYTVHIADESVLEARLRELRSIFPRGIEGDTPEDEGVLEICYSSLDPVSFTIRYGRTILEHGFTLELNGVKVEKATERLRIEVTSGIDWFGIRASLTDEFDLSAVDLDLLQYGFLSRGKRYTYIGREDAERLMKLLDAMEGSDGFRIRSRDIAAVYAVSDLVTDFVPPDFARLAGIAGTLLSLKGLPEYPLPSGFTGNLRGYQETGYRWMRFLTENGYGGCLADDMGLGKTVQTLTLLQALREAGEIGPCLVVAPVSTLHNWEAEARRFTPGLGFSIHRGSGRSRSIQDLAARDVIAMSYGTLRMDIGFLDEIEFLAVVLDEAQMIKNPHSKTAHAVRSLTARNRFTLTGTPVENSAVDLWSQIEFIEPGLLGSLPSFKRRFAGNTSDRKAGSRGRLKLMTAPFVLRRTKAAVEPSLPRKEEIVRYVEMGRRQKEVYDSTRLLFRERLRAAVASGDIGEIGAAIFEGLLRLRQIACIPEHAERMLRGVPSAKLEVFEELLDSILSGGHKTLVFSQFLKSLSVLEQMVRKRGIGYCRLDGSTEDRKEVISRFQEDETIRVFLISLKAGGVGINLTAANYVVIFDPWWNPAVENQAIDRTHRIGQNRSVFVYRLITRGTVEERIRELQERKSKLAGDLILDDPRPFGGLSVEELAALFE